MFIYKNSCVAYVTLSIEFDHMPFIKMFLNEMTLHERNNISNYIFLLLNK